MALGKRKDGTQGELFIYWQELQSSSNAFYEALDSVLCAHEFDLFVEEACQEFYAERVGRPGLAPGGYFRMLMIGYLEGLGSERAIAWRCSDSISLRTFLGYTVTEPAPDHSTLSKTRKRLSVEVHMKVFVWVLSRLKEAGLLRGKTLGIDSTTLEANAAMRSIVRRDTGQAYAAFLESLAKESGIETPTREDLAKLDKTRPNKGSNKDWVHPKDPEARIGKMKDGRTHLAHKCEHAVDLDSGPWLR
ncbi:MAG: transposase [Bacteroidetes bacterium]|nr:transposase [Bacteroidota bacterium]MCY4205071.1 transposase [Bacteroidota bacterium]